MGYMLIVKETKTGKIISKQYDRYKEPLQAKKALLQCIYQNDDIKRSIKIVKA